MKTNSFNFPPIPHRHLGRRPRRSALRLGLAAAICVAWQNESRAVEPAAQNPTTVAALAAAGTNEVATHRKLSLEQLMNIEVITVSRTESTVGQSPAAVSVITQEDIRRSGATTIPELFRMVPGMNVARLDNNKWDIGARGFNQRFQDKLLVQVDGRSIYNPIFSGVYWDTVDYPLEDIERIEIIRGPGGSTWGANAVNGIISIITKSAKETQGGLVSSGGGTEERGFGTIRYGGKINNNLFYRVYGQGFDRDEQFSRGASPKDSWSGASGGLRLDWQPSDRDAVTFDGGYGHSAAGRKDLRPMSTAPFVLTNIEDEVSNLGHVLARWSHTLDKDASWALQAYWDHFDRASGNDIIDFAWDTYDVDFQHQFPLGARQKVVYGAGYRFVEATLQPRGQDDGFAVNWLRSRRQTQLESVFVQDQITLVEDEFSVTLGTKVEHNDFTGVEVQPTGRLLWTPTKRQTVWAAVSRAVRTPNLSEDEVQIRLLSKGSPVFPLAIANRNLKSEEVMAYELGYRAQAADTLSVDTALFYNVYNGVRANAVPGKLSPGPGGTSNFLLPYANGLDGETYGVELATTWQVADSWRLYGAYTFLEMQLHRNHGLGLGKSAEAPEGQSPQHQVYLKSSWNLPGNVEFDLIGRFVDRLSGFNPSGAPGVSDTVDAYLSLDARLAWRPRKNLTLAVVGQNLLDNHHPEFGTNPLIRSPLVELQRGVYGKVTWTF